MTKRMLIMVGCVILLVAALAFGKYLQIQKLIASSPKPGAQTVTAIKVTASAWQPQINAVGTLAPVRGVDVTTEIAGMVRKVNFKSGDEVKAGQVLFELNAESDIAQLRSLQAAAGLAETTLKRDRLQLAAQAISQAQVDSSEAELKTRQALAEEQKAQVAKKTIRAPFSGKLGITAVNPGQYLNPGDTLVTLQTIDTVYVDFFVPQKQVAGLAPGQKLKLTSDAFPGVSFPAKVTAISPKVDAGTRNVQVQATVPNDKRQLLPGMFANVSLDQGEAKQYLTLPQTAITYNPYGSTVFVLAPAQAKDGKEAPKDDKGNPQLLAQQVFVTTGATRGDQVAVLSGVKEGQTVVTSGQLKLKNGTPVVVNNKVQPANSANPTPQEQ
ncbi:MAG: efflux RND transporter periplasmic adaptor subunit [Duganella sp.]